MKRISVMAIFAAFMAFLAPVDALACACCAEKGTYSISTRKPDSYEIGELKKLKIKSTNLYLDAGAEDTVKGIAPLGENFSSGWTLKNSGWSFDFKDNDGKAGSLTLPMGGMMVDFRVDIHDREEGDPLLYREFRFKSKVGRGSGIFQKGIAPATDYFLVLQGRGNNCTSAETFTHWRLEIMGKKASYAFFGELTAE